MISPEIKANISLRIALRVTDSAESVDVIASDAAASIDKHTPGRAFVRAGSTPDGNTDRPGRRALTDRRRRAVVTGLDEWGRRPAGYTLTEGGKQISNCWLTPCERLPRDQVSGCQRDLGCRHFPFIWH